LICYRFVIVEKGGKYFFIITKKKGAMRFVFILLLLLITHLTNNQLFASNNATLHTANGKLLDFDATNFDAGTLYIGDESFPYFSFVNRTHKNVRIQSITPNKGRYNDPFRVVKIDTNKIIKPGQRDTIFFRRYHSYSSPKAGRYDLSWTVRFVDSDVEQFLNIFCLLQENRGEIVMEPIHLKTVKLGEIIAFTSCIKNTGADTVTLRKPDASNFTTYLDEFPIKIAPSSERFLHFKVNTESFSNRYRENVILGTNMQSKDYLRIPIYGEVIAPNRPDIYFDTIVKRIDIMEGGDGRYIFTYTNTGDMPLIISRCNSSCGCVVPSCSRDPLAPGDTGVVHVKYDSKRVGPINKTVTITSNAVKPRIVLRITGNVTRIARDGEIPNRVNTNRSKISFYKRKLFIYYQEKSDKEVLFHFKNEGEDSLRIIRTLAGSGISIKHIAEAVAPGERGWVSATYDTKQLGKFNRYIRVVSDGAPYETILELRGIVYPKNDTIPFGPKLSFARTAIDTVFKYGADARFEFPFKNTGNTPLIFSCAKSSVPISDYPKAPINPGESGVIKVKYDSHRVGDFRFKISLCHNDTSSQAILKISGIVKPKPDGSEEQKERVRLGPQITFDSTSIYRIYEYYGSGHEEFTFTNTGDEPLIIQYPKTSGGLMVTSPAKPIMPGEKGVISTRYDTKRPGPFSRSILVYHNGENGKTILYYKGLVRAKQVNATKKGPEITFDSTLIKRYYEYNERAEIAFVFTNTGDEPLIINTSKSSGGLIATSPRNPILPGEKGIIHAKYNTQREGLFSKSITVVHNAGIGKTMLHFKGKVNPKPTPTPHEADPSIGPQITFDSTQIYRNFSYGADGRFEFVYTNTGDEPLIVHLALASDGGLNYTHIENQTVNPGKQGKIIGYYSTKREGIINGSIRVYHNAPSKNTILRLKGKSIINPNPKISQPHNDSTAASIQFDTLIVERNFELTEKVAVEFTYTNMGGSTLKLNKVIASDGGVITLLYPLTPAGETGIIRCTYPTNKIGPFNRSIIVYQQGTTTPIILKFKGVIF
jgi:hypothetical protein